MDDAFASIRKRMDSRVASFDALPKHGKHETDDPVFVEKLRISANKHPKHPKHGAEPLGLRMRDLAHLPAHWTDAMRSLAQASVPRCARPERWQQIVRDAAAFLLHWHDRADELGWTIGHVFGLDPDEPNGALGLVLSIGGGKVRRLFVDERGRHAAHIERGGANEVALLFIRGDAPPVWALADLEQR